MSLHRPASAPVSAEAALARVDLHVHTTASEESKLGVQRSVGLPECMTAPEEVHALARARGMDFVAITDHDTIDGAGRPHAPGPLLRGTRALSRAA